MVADGTRPAGGGLRWRRSAWSSTNRRCPSGTAGSSSTSRSAGKGPPLVYLHPAAGLAWDPFLERLAAQRTIHAPRVPGTTPGKPEAIREVDDLWDLVLVYEEAIRALGLDRPAVIGQSFGGMLACRARGDLPGALQPSRAPRPDRALARRAPGRELGRGRAGGAARAALPRSGRRGSARGDDAARRPRAPRSPRSQPFRGRSAARRSSSGRSRTRASRSGCTGSRRRR